MSVVFCAAENAVRGSGWLCWLSVAAESVSTRSHQSTNNMCGDARDPPFTDWWVNEQIYGWRKYAYTAYLPEIGGVSFFIVSRMDGMRVFDGTAAKARSSSNKVPLQVLVFSTGRTPRLRSVRS